MAHLDQSPPTITAITPRNGTTAASHKATIVIRIEDSGVAKINIASLHLSINTVPVVANGVVVPGTPWAATKVVPWEDGATPTVVELHAIRAAVHSYGEVLEVVVVASDNSNNADSRTFNYTVETSPLYDGTDANAVMSALELSLLTSFDNSEAETFRKRVLFGLVPGAVPESSLERQAVRRLVQLVYRYEQDPIVTRMWLGEPKHNDKAMPGARTYVELNELHLPFGEALKQVLYTMARIVDEGLLDHVRYLSATNAVAASVVLLAILCKMRDVEGLRV